MSINPDDVKLFESQRLTDEDDGGGRATGIEIIDGNINNLFPDISRLDRTLGDVALRKCFVGVATDNSDTYLGAHAIIVKPPTDPNVNVVMFDAGSESDTRLEAQDRIESYVVQGAAAGWELIGNQYENQRQLVAVQREEQALPSTGDVYMLKDGDNTQYIRVTEVESEITTFTYEYSGTFTDFTRRRMILSISAPLEHTFPGGQVKPSGTTTPKSEIFQTEVADAARYWGVTYSTDDVAQSDLMVKVSSIYASLVPSAQTEQSIADQVLGYDRLTVRESADDDHVLALTGTYISSKEMQVYINRPCVPGTLIMTLSGSAYADDGSGILVRSSGTFPFATLRLDYDTGTITGTRDSGSGSGTFTGTATFRPGAAFTGRAESISTPITLTNRGFNFNRTFAAAKPRPGTMVIAYMVQGKWYEIRDPGNGVLGGYGVGTVNFVTGTVSITLQELPDVDSSIIYSYLMDIEEEVEKHNGTLASAIPSIELTLEQGVAPGSLIITYTAAEVEKTLTDDGLGALSGDGEGTIDYSNGEVSFTQTVLHDDGTSIDVVYDVTNPLIASGTADPETGIFSGTLASAPVTAGGVSMRAVIDSIRGATGKAYSHVKTVTDDGVGGFIGASGTINYTTGEFSVEFLANRSVGYIPVTYLTDGTQVIGETEYRSVRETGGTISVRYQESTATYDPVTSSFNPNQLVLTLIDSGDDPIMPTSMLFTFAGTTYFDRDGILYKDFSSTTGAGAAVGTVDYNGKTVTLESWNGGSGPGVVIHAMLTQSLATLVSRISMRTPGAPLRPQSFQITVNDREGNIISVTADVDGDLVSDSLSGHVNVETGVAELWFTTDNADDTGGSDVLVFPTGRYNAVLYSFLPLDAELIGLDPVRLPSDGRVPFVREGDVLVLSETAITDAGTPVADEQIDLARDHQASIVVKGANGLLLDPDMYIANLLTGIVTFANPLTLETADAEALETPLNIEDRIEHMTVVNDVQINGEISFNTPTGHAFPAETTVVSSALVWGDINSRVFKFFTQKTWNSGSPNWTDERVGDDTTAQYNDIDNPIEYANNGAITEKWALQFTSTTAFNIVGEQLGIIGEGSTAVDLAPINPNTGFPYFVLRADGWGGGWANNNVVRFNTEGCLAAMWLARTTLSGQAQELDDEFTIQVRGDAD